MHPRESKTDNQSRQNTLRLGRDAKISLAINKLLRAGYLHTTILTLFFPLLPFPRQVFRNLSLFLSLFIASKWADQQKRQIERLGNRYHLKNWAARSTFGVLFNFFGAYLELLLFFPYLLSAFMLPMILLADYYVGHLNPVFGEDPLEQFIVETSAILNIRRDIVLENLYYSLYSNHLMIIDPRPYFSERQFSWPNHHFHLNFLHRIQREWRDYYLNLLSTHEYHLRNGFPRPLLRSYHNTHSFLNQTPVSQIEDLIVLDGYAFSIEELISQAEMNPENYYRNPHQQAHENHDFSESAADKMLRNPSLKPYTEKINNSLQTQASHIQAKTIDAVLIYLRYLHQHQIAGNLKATQDLLNYMLTLSTKEHIALQHYTIRVKSLFGGYQNLKFKDAITGSNAQCIQIVQIYGWQFVVDLRPKEFVNIPASVIYLCKIYSLKIQANPIHAKMAEVKDEKEILSPSTQRNLDAFAAAQSSLPNRAMHYLKGTLTDLFTLSPFFTNMHINRRVLSSALEDKETKEDILFRTETLNSFMEGPHGLFHESRSQTYQSRSLPSRNTQDVEWKEGKPQNPEAEHKDTTRHHP